MRECLSARGLNLDTVCPTYQVGFESILHALRDCPLVRNIWQQLGVSPADPSFFAESLEDWLTSNCKANSKSDER